MSITNFILGFIVGDIRQLVYSKIILSGVKSALNTHGFKLGQIFKKGARP